jgi:dienelactone hydrolase
MANGFSGTMDWVLPAFAERFVAADIAVCTFDYRHLGESTGNPRQVIDIDKQREDLVNAINFVKRYEGIDPNRIALWGTSLGGNHVVEVAARTPGIKALICNMPAIDAIKGANVKAKIKSLGATRLQLMTVTLRLVLAAVWDLLRGSLGLSPYYLKVYGQPGKAFFTDPVLAKNFQRVAAQSATWQNKIAARFLLKPPRYKDGTLERVKAPILFSLAEKDVEVSATFIRKKAARANLAEIKEYPFGHFELYHGAAFEQVVRDQIAFLQKHL